MKLETKIYNYCTACYKLTNHTVKGLHTVEGNWDYQTTHHYAVVECNGCNNVSFRKEVIDHESMEYDPDSGSYFPQTDVSYFPKALEGHRNELETHYIPDNIIAVYQDTIKAFTSEAYLLTGVGFRAIIEAICIDQKIRIKDFEDLKQQIDKMYQKKLITLKEASRLHTIRFLGNDSIHAMVVPKKEDLHVVLHIIENLLNNLYVIDQQIKGGLEKMIPDFAGFRTLLNFRLNKFVVGDSISLGKLLEKSARRLGDQASEFEKELISKIETGQYTKLGLGEIKPNPDNTKPDIQYYVVLDLSYDKDASF
ncbi:DUF4145 domain-containing protein [Pedobacter psychroterrae]|uniref:DUF4145 domain-containing protein n=1 Tax=Pedobacter psychroterrae TaxID=2530453 RepID=A0A4R0NVZ1_9SPHI|nr:DUF4145 domain-containing protein [Pedobacter psychroterrae]TCD03204.1 DUF4145 domain-containing protein [Pedobacter psychroterrae]